MLLVPNQCTPEQKREGWTPKTMRQFLAKSCNDDFRYLTPALQQQYFSGEETVGAGPNSTKFYLYMTFKDYEIVHERMLLGKAMMK